MSLLGSVLDAGRQLAPLAGSVFGPWGSAVGTALGAGLGAWEGFEGQQEAQELQRETWNREDTAIQRRVADLRAAGLSPTLAAGSAASSAPPISSMQQISGGEQERGFSGAQFVMNMLSQSQSIAQTQAETERIRQDTFNKQMTGQQQYQGLQASQMPFPDPFHPGQNNPAWYIEQEFKTNMEYWDYKIRQQGVTQSEIKTEMMNAGLTEAQADASISQIAAKQAGEVDEYFIPWLAPGTGAGYVKGAVGSLLQKLVP